MRVVYGFVLAGCVFLATSVIAADRLPAFTGDPQGTSVSGLSSGAFMAMQYQVAFSSSVRGAGIVAGGPYYCAAGIALNAAVCMGQVDGKPPAPKLMLTAARLFAAGRGIDSLDNLKRHRVYVFSGTNDRVVKPPAVEAAVQFYKLAGVADAAISYVNTVPAGHAMITPQFGGDCGANAAPWLNHCVVDGVGYDQAGAVLAQIYGDLKPPASTPGGRVIAFDQKEFAADAARMADDAYVYVPQSCAGGASCRLHIAFHGCDQSADAVGDRFYMNAGFNRWADTNDIIVLYPQVNKSAGNPQGCWDWFGYTNKSYPTKEGPQLKAVKAMADRLLGGK